MNSLARVLLTICFIINYNKMFDEKLKAALCYKDKRSCTAHANILCLQRDKGPRRYPLIFYKYNSSINLVLLLIIPDGRIRKSIRSEDSVMYDIQILSFQIS